MGERTRLIAARKRRGLTQADLGEIIGLHQTGVSRIELGEVLPNGEQVRDLMRELGLSIDDVLADGPEETASPAARAAEGE